MRGNGSDPETGRPIHSSLMLTDTDEYFARTRNEYFQPVIEDYTAENLVQAYYDALDKQEKAEGTTTVTKEVGDKMYAKERLPFDTLMEKVGEAIQKMCEVKRDDEVVDIVGKKHLEKVERFLSVLQNSMKQ